MSCPTGAPLLRLRVRPCPCAGLPLLDSASGIWLTRLALPQGSQLKGAKNEGMGKRRFPLGGGILGMSGSRDGIRTASRVRNGICRQRWQSFGSGSGLARVKNDRTGVRRIPHGTVRIRDGGAIRADAPRGVARQRRGASPCEFSKPRRHKRRGGASCAGLPTAKSLDSLESLSI